MKIFLLALLFGSVISLCNAANMFLHFKAMEKEFNERNNADEKR